MPYFVSLTKHAIRLIRKLDPPVRAFIFNELDKLKINPYLAPSLKGRFSFLRSHHTNFRGVAYRIIFEIREGAREVLVYIVGSRGAVYKLLERFFR